MAYLSLDQASSLLNQEGRGATFDALDDTRKNELLELASARIESIPFAGESTIQPRFTNGLLTGTDIPMPLKLQRATAILALWYIDNRYVDYSTFGGSRDTGSLSPFMSDLPLAVQTALWDYVSADVKLGRGQRKSGAVRATMGSKQGAMQ